MNSTQRIMWKRIIENPQDEFLRLVYADYLEETGSTKAAGKIRHQDKFCNQRKFHSGCKEYRYKWRGYVSKLEITYHTYIYLINHQQYMFEMWPVGWIEFTSYPSNEKFQETCIFNPQIAFSLQKNCYRY